MQYLVTFYGEKKLRMKKISIVGPESSGKSTLGIYLSRVLECSLVLEYSREYLRNKKKYEFSDLIKIAEKQNMLYNKKINEGGSFIISDTCLLDIEIWSEIKYKKVDKKISKLRINKDGFCQKSGYKLQAHDISHLSKCHICNEFMPLVSNLVNTCSEEPYKIEVNRGYLQNRRFVTRTTKACQIPICGLCRNSKQRQEKFRYQMFNSFQSDLDENGRIEYHTTMSWAREKPDISHIPTDIELYWDTPLDYAGYYKFLIQPRGPSYWHPELSADEYMRYMEYERQKTIASADPLDDYPED